MSTSQSEKRRDSYHHGSLRSALIATGVEMLAEEGADALSLRSLARRAGVSHNAPYQHFADKEALMAAIAEQGFLILADYIDRSQTGNNPEHIQQRLLAAGRGYVRFALEHPHHFQIMFGPRSHSAYPELLSAARAAFNRLTQIVIDGQRAGVLRDGDPRDPAMAVWLTAHGLSALLIAEKIPPDIVAGREPLELTARYIEMVCAGLLMQGGFPIP
jgi:AcrR family transcriptional regulator